MNEPQHIVVEDFDSFTKKKKRENEVGLGVLLLLLGIGSLILSFTIAPNLILLLFGFWAVYLGLFLIMQNDVFYSNRKKILMGMLILLVIFILKNLTLTIFLTVLIRIINLGIKYSRLTLISIVVLILIFVLFKKKLLKPRRKSGDKKKVKRCVRCGKPVQNRKHRFCSRCWKIIRKKRRKKKKRKKRRG